GCQFNCNSLNSPDQWDAIHITRSSGSKTCSAIIEGNNFAASGEIEPRHHINLSGAAANGVHIGRNSYGACSDRAVNVAESAMRCTVNGLGYNGAADPNVGGQWFGYGEEGLRVLRSDTSQIYEYADWTWRSLGATPASTIQGARPL